MCTSSNTYRKVDINLDFKMPTNEDMKKSLLDGCPMSDKEFEEYKDCVVEAYGFVESKFGKDLADKYIEECVL